MPKKCGFLLVANGAYGMRMKLIADAHGIPVTVVKCGDNEHPSLAAIEEALKKNPQHTHVAMVHSETTSGIVNDVTPVGALGGLSFSYFHLVFIIISPLQGRTI